jgi:hypothetical protein
MLNFGVDGFHAHLRIGPGQNGQDGPTDRPELTPAVRPTSAR